MTATARDNGGSDIAPGLRPAGDLLPAGGADQSQGRSLDDPPDLPDETLPAGTEQALRHLLTAVMQDHRAGVKFSTAVWRAVTDADFCVTHINTRQGTPADGP